MIWLISDHSLPHLRQNCALPDPTIFVTIQPRELRINNDDVSLTVFDYPGENPPILFAHANSFHGRIWDQVIAHLPGRQCYAVDLRGHGRSDKPAAPYLWRLFGHDLVNIAHQLNIRNAIGVGHSLGGHATTLAAALDPQLFRALLLVDPVILRPSQYIGTLAGEHYSARRRSRFESPESMIERFRDRLPFSRWEPSVLRDYCEYGLLPADDGYVLACPPSVEAEIYTRSTDKESNIYPEIATIDIPVRIMRAGTLQENPAEDLSASPTAPNLVQAFRHAVDIPLPDHSHFIPMESPLLVAQHVQELLIR